MKELAIVYIVAGLSSRFGGKIKQFAKVGPSGETLIEYSLNQAISVGFSKIVFVVGPNTESQFIEKFGFKYKGVPIFYGYQAFDQNNRDRPWGTADALCSATEFLDCPFVICTGDDIYGECSFKILYDHLQNNENSAAIGHKLGNVLSKKGTVNRGIVNINKDGKVTSIADSFNLTESNLAEKGLSIDTPCNMLIFGLHPNDLNLINQSLSNFKESNKGNRKVECMLPNEIGNLIGQGKISMDFHHTNDQWFGITNPEDEFIVKEQLSKLDK